MVIKMKIRDMIDTGIWEAMGRNPWVMNEGLADGDDMETVEVKGVIPLDDYSRSREKNLDPYSPHPLDHLDDR